MPKTPTPKITEAQTQRLILDWLVARKIWHMRINTGAMSGSHKGKSWFVKFAKPGTADILASWADAHFYWIEVKSPAGKLSEAQEAFREEVEAQGHIYILARSLEDVTEVLG